MSAGPVERLNAALEGRYRIERELGEGGMATVYLADDLKHERKVALKVLKPELAAVVGAERFLAEIKTTANLQHPHILPLFDSGEADSFLFYVMPYVEGESLRERLDREHQLPVDEAVRIATNVAEALDYAHKRGVIHRDIKPANILLQSGKPVISDFGIALAVGTAGQGRLTETGLSMGTPHYMSPEQATGDLGVGAPTDVYALGCVLYEMLIGEPPYTGSTAQAILGKIIAGELTPARKLRSSVPAHVDAAIRRALEKVPADRFTGAHALARALADPGFRHGEAEGAAAGPSESPRVRLLLTVTAVALLLAAWTSWMAIRGRPGLPASAGGGVARFALVLPESARQSFPVGVGLTVSPDNSKIVFVGPSESGGRAQLWQRDLEQLEVRPIPGTEDGTSPVYSPDGLSVVFQADESIKTISLDGGPAVTLARDVPGGSFVGLDWGPDGMIYYNARGLTLRMPASGGSPDTLPVPAHGPGDGVYGRVEALPGGGLVLTRLAPFSEIVTLSADGALEVRFPGLAARYAPSGHLVYLTPDLTLMAVPFDPLRLEVTGSPVALQDQPGLTRFNYAQFTISDGGWLGYAPRRRMGLLSVGRDGEVRELEPGWDPQIQEFALSPDGASLAVSMTTPRSETQDIWIKQLGGGPLQRLTFEGTMNRSPVWSPDGQSILFISNRSGEIDLWMTRADGVGEPTLIGGGVQSGVWSPDGEWLLLTRNTGRDGDIMVMRLGVDSVPQPLIATGLSESSPALSPDGRWLAYTTQELEGGGRSNVFVSPFPNSGEGRWQVSTDADGNVPFWSNTGRELFYRLSGGGIAAVDVSTSPNFQASVPRALFRLEVDPRAGIDISPDDDRFVLVAPLASARHDPDFIVVQNFFEELKRLAPN